MSSLTPESKFMENMNLLLKRLLEQNIDFILIGGYAAVLHGSSQVTHDLDICAVITPDQLIKLKSALKGLDPHHRMNKSHQPSLDEYPAASSPLLDNYYLKTTSGILDVIKNVEPIGSFETLKKNAINIQIFGHTCAVISLDDLITVKKNMTRDKDKIVLAELLLVKEKLTAK